MVQLLEQDATFPFTPQRAAAEAARARRMENIYHVGQAKIWDGREVLRNALERHPTPPGGQRIPRREREALAHVFSIMMWGELAAWRVSAQLVDMVSEPEERLAATSQAHDEARHFYVFHDYLETLGVVPPPLDPHTRSFLNACIATRSTLNKVVGMQLFVENIALTLFKAVREMNVDPALSEVLTFFERDEARHVGFGVQVLPRLMAASGAGARASLLAFEARVLGAMLLSLKRREADLHVLGVNPRNLLTDGRTRFVQAVEDYRREAGQAGTPEGRLLTRAYELILARLFP
ncbi:MAG: ferritin-like domain-containing protein [Myxococcota bacterium]